MSAVVIFWMERQKSRVPMSGGKCPGSRGPVGPRALTVMTRKKHRAAFRRRYRPARGRCQYVTHAGGRRGNCSDRGCGPTVGTTVALCLGTRVDFDILMGMGFATWEWEWLIFVCQKIPWQMNNKVLAAWRSG